MEDYYIPIIFRKRGLVISGECPNYPGAKNLIKKMAKRDGVYFNMYESKDRIIFSFKYENETNPERRDE